MNKNPTTCHRCIEDESFPTLLRGVKGKCYTCNGAGYLTVTHASLFEVGFAEEVNLNGEYSMFLYKVLNELETIEVQVKRAEGEFQIATINFNSLNAMEYLGRIWSIGDLIQFLKAN